MKRHHGTTRRTAPLSVVSRLMPPIAMALLASSLATAPVLAQEEEPPGAIEPESGTSENAPEEMAREGVELLLRALRGFLSSVPQYGLPRIEENGDIVIPRLNREEENEQDQDGDDTDGSDDSPEEIRT